MANIKLYELKKLQTNFPAKKIVCSKDAYDFIRQFYSDDMEIFESCFILMLNNANKTIGYAKISQGGITGTVVDIRIINKYAVESMAISIIIAHNHPSGVLEASQADRDITRKLQQSMKTLDIRVADHLILTSHSFYSFADKGIL